MTAGRAFQAIVPFWLTAAALSLLWLPQTETGFDKLVRLALCAPLLMFFPGYLLAGLLRLKGDVATRITLAVSLSLAISILLGLVLHLLGHLDAKGWLYGLELTTSVLWCVDILLPLASLHSPIPWAWPGPRFVIFAVSAILAISSVLVARPVALERKPFHFTELWMVPKGQWTNNVMTIGVRNSEDTRMRYSLDLVLGGRLIGKMPSFELASSASQTFDIAVPTGTQAPARLEALLYKDADRSVIYRKVWMTINPPRQPTPRITGRQPADLEAVNG